jgi:hypothetical protein
MLAALILLFSINVPAGDAVDTIQILNFQTQSGSFYDVKELGHVNTNPVKGFMTILDAWCALLMDTGITFKVLGVEKGAPFYLRVHPEHQAGDRDRLCQDRPSLVWGPESIEVPKASWKWIAGLDSFGYQG